MTATTMFFETMTYRRYQIGRCEFIQFSSYEDVSIEIIQSKYVENKPSDTDSWCSIV